MSNRRRYYPSVQPDADGDGLVSHAGAVALVETARAAGLDHGLARALTPWRKPTAVHDPGKIVLNLAVALAAGGTCLADIAVLREQPGVFGPVASDPTVSRAIDTLAADAPLRWRRSPPRGLRPAPRCGRRRARPLRTLMSQQTDGWVIAEGIEDADMLTAVLGDTHGQPLSAPMIAGQGSFLGRSAPAPTAIDTRLDLPAPPRPHIPSG